MHGEHSTVGPLETRSAAPARSASDERTGRGEAPRPKDGSGALDVDSLVSNFLDELDAISIVWGVGEEPPRKEDARSEAPAEAPRETPPVPSAPAGPEAESPAIAATPAPLPAPTVAPDYSLQAAEPGAAVAHVGPAPAPGIPGPVPEAASVGIEVEPVENAAPAGVFEVGPEPVDLDVVETAGEAPSSATALVTERGVAHLEPTVTGEDLDKQLAETLDELEREQLRAVPLTIREKAGQGRALTVITPDSPPAGEPAAEQDMSAVSPGPAEIQEGGVGPAEIPGYSANQEVPRRETAGDAVHDLPPALAETVTAPAPAAAEEPGGDSSSVVVPPAVREPSGSDEPVSVVPAVESLPDTASEQVGTVTKARAAIISEILSAKTADANTAKSAPDAESDLRTIFQVRQQKRGVLRSVMAVCLIFAVLWAAYEIVKSLRSNPAWSHLPAASTPAPTDAATGPAGGFPAGDAAEADTVPAAPLQKVIPPYPEAARGVGIAGEVEFEVDVDEKGNVTRVTPVSGPEVFYADAGQALRKWVFRPASRRGAPIPSTVRVTVEFKP